jgi:hypothetical protein
MIEKTLSNAEVMEIFEQEAVFFHGKDAIPEYRIIELFGAAVGDYIVKNIHYNGYLIAGKDWNGCGACSQEQLFVRYFYKTGYMKIVSEHNYMLTVRAHRDSEAGKMVDMLWKERKRKLDELDAEENKKEGTENVCL